MGLSMHFQSVLYENFMLNLWEFCIQDVLMFSCVKFLNELFESLVFPGSISLVVGLVLVADYQIY